MAIMAIIECVPNISEGRRPEVVARIADALRGVAGVRVLDVQSDAVAPPLGPHPRRRPRRR